MKIILLKTSLALTLTSSYTGISSAFLTSPSSSSTSRKPFLPKTSKHTITSLNESYSNPNPTPYESENQLVADAVAQACAEMQTSYDQTIQQLKQQMQEEKETSLQQVMERAAFDLEQVQAEAKERINEALQMGAEAADYNENAKVAALKEEYEANLLKAQESYEAVLEWAKVEADSVSGKLEELQQSQEEEIHEMKMHHTELVDELRAQTAHDKAEALAALKDEALTIIKNLEISHEAIIQESVHKAQQNHELKLEESVKSYTDEIDSLRNAYADVQFSFQNLADEHQKDKEAYMAESENILENVQRELKTQSSKAIEQMRNELSESYEAEIARCKQDASEEMQKVCEEMAKSAEENIKVALDIATEEHTAAMDELQSKAIEERNNMELDFNMWHEKQMEKSDREHKSAIEELTTFLNSQTTDAIENIKDKYETEIQKSNSALNDKNQEFEEVTSKVKSLEQALMKERQSAAELKAHFDSVATSTEQGNFDVEGKVREITLVFQDQIATLNEKLEETEQMNLLEKQRLNEMYEEQLQSLIQSHEAQMKELTSAIKSQSDVDTKSLQQEYEAALAQIIKELEGKDDEVNKAYSDLKSLTEALEEERKNATQLKANFDLVAATAAASQTAADQSLQATEQEKYNLDEKMSELNARSSPPAAVFSTPPPPPADFAPATVTENTLPPPIAAAEPVSFAVATSPAPGNYLESLKGVASATISGPGLDDYLNNIKPSSGTGMGSYLDSVSDSGPLEFSEVKKVPTPPKEPSIAMQPVAAAVTAPVPVHKEEPETEEQSEHVAVNFITEHNVISAFEIEMEENVAQEIEIAEKNANQDAESYTDSSSVDVTSLEREAECDITNLAEAKVESLINNEAESAVEKIVGDLSLAFQTEKSLSINNDIIPSPSSTSKTQSKSTFFAKTTTKTFVP